MIFEQADKELKEKRREICNDCPKKRGKFKLLGITFAKRDQCVVCLCDIKNKTAIKLERCPIGKW